MEKVNVSNTPKQTDEFLLLFCVHGWVCMQRSDDTSVQLLLSAHLYVDFRGQTPVGHQVCGLQFPGLYSKPAPLRDILSQAMEHRECDTSVQV